MSTPTDTAPRLMAKLIRIGIPLLRSPSILGAATGLGLYIHFGMIHFGMDTFIRYRPPFRKEFWDGIVTFVWIILSLIPFIILRSRRIYWIYIALFTACILFRLYDYFTPLRYIAPGYTGRINEPDGRYSSSDGSSGVYYWISGSPWPLTFEQYYMNFLRITPLILAVVYRNSYRLWAVDRKRELPDTGPTSDVGREDWRGPGI